MAFPPTPSPSTARGTLAEAERVYAYFDSVDLRWTSGPVRFAEVGKEAVTFSFGTAASSLAEFQVTGVEIAFRESVFTRSAGLQLLNHVPSVDPIGEVIEGEGAAIADTRRKFKGKLAEAEKLIGTLTEFYGKVTRFWSAESQRILGHVLYSPPIFIGTGDKCFTEDWALVELHLRDVVKDELRHPTMLNANGEECLIVAKNGNTTGATIGRATGIESFVREYDEYGICSTSMEVAIYLYSHKDGAFSAPGDSGSIIADAMGASSAS
ncbi:uncharacterized protein B0H18DRAFT_1120039 [Fomitopsis serialis]|uniref:uncharacterized protein n=1 Tax=Fomitopsis serialis TaxID=139415 RepID=UPI0020089A8A|nr:uncharacterized protein B0H18DRAFT_1120039 [Neoantrodia serialis]KAH9924179.1 hypothetical protein B0H18DRAFT_1120039 [Neoantrodia serialis]